MKKLTMQVIIPICVLALILPVVANEGRAKLSFDTLGFSIDALEASPNAGSFQALMMFLPATEGMAPNVNVQVHQFPGTIDEYLAISKQQFQELGWTVVNESYVDGTIIFEYSGVYQGVTAHWYARAVKKEGTVYLTTGTALESQWASVGQKLKTCVDSFELHK